MSDPAPLTEAQNQWFVTEVRKCAAMGMPLGCCDEWPECSHVVDWTEARDAAAFYRYRESVVETLRYISTNAGSGDHGVEIAGMASGLLRNLGQE